MNFWDRKKAYESGWVDKSAFEKKGSWHAAPTINSGEYIFRDGSGVEAPISFDKGLIIEHKFSSSTIASVIVKAINSEKKMTYKERQAEIEEMMNSITDGLYLVYEGYATLLGKSLEDYTQKELYDTLKRFQEEHK